MNSNPRFFPAMAGTLLTAALALQVLDDDALRVRMSANCRSMVEGYSPEACAEGLRAAAKGAAQNGTTSFGTAWKASPPHVQ